MIPTNPNELSNPDDMSPKDREMMDVGPETETQISNETGSLLEAGDLARLERLAELAKRISVGLSLRAQERFNPVIDERAISMFSSLGAQLGELAQTTNPDQTAEIQTVLEKLTHLFG